MLRANSNPAHLGVGLYSIADAGRLVSVPPGRVHRWLSSRLVKQSLDPSEQTMTFAELMELHFIKMFRSQGVSLQAIRQAAAAAAKRFGTDYPFSFRRFDTDGRTIFATLIRDSSNETILEDLKRGQLVFNQIVKPFFKKLEYQDSVEVARFWPMEKSGRVVLDPERKFGRPIDAQSGISTRVICDAVMAGGGQEPSEVARWLGIPFAAVNAAVAFEQSLAA